MESLRDTGEGQEKLARFFSNEVIACQSMLIDALLAKEIFSWDDIENLYWKDPETEESEEPQEIFEWWLVTDWLADKLAKHGEPVIRNDYGVWWGRTCTGQAIVLDYVIEEIYIEIGW